MAKIILSMPERETNMWISNDHSAMIDFVSGQFALNMRKYLYLTFVHPLRIFHTLVFARYLICRLCPSKIFTRLL